MFFFAIYFLVILILGIFLDKDLRHYRQLLKRTGFCEVFLEEFGTGTTFINMGIMGLLSLGFVLLTGAHLTGPLVGGILSVVGYAAIGKHPLNSIPVVLGIVLSALLADADLSDNSVLMTCLFGTALAPITGEFGIIPGIIAGFLHFAVSSITSGIHGGLVLYNNGFASGFVAVLVANVLVNLPNKIFRKNITKH